MSSETGLFAVRPSHEDISQRARQLWEAAGAPLDRDLEFWLAAESSLRQPERSQAASTESAVPKRTAARRR